MLRFWRFLYLSSSTLSFFFFWLSLVTNYQYFLHQTVELVFTLLSGLSFSAIVFALAYGVALMSHSPPTVKQSRSLVFLVVNVVFQALFFLLSRVFFALSRSYGTS